MNFHPWAKWLSLLNHVNSCTSWTVMCPESIRSKINSCASWTVMCTESTRSKINSCASWTVMCTESTRSKINSCTPWTLCALRASLCVCNCYWLITHRWEHTKAREEREEKQQWHVWLGCDKKVIVHNDTCAIEYCCKEPWYNEFAWWKLWHVWSDPCW